MIQRVQSIFLLAASAFIITLLFTSITVLGGNDTIIEVKPFLFGDGVQESINAVAGVLYYTIAIIISALLSVVTIFMYKRRDLQLRLCSLNIVLLLGIQVFIGYILYKSDAFVDQMNIVEPGFSAGIIYSVFNAFPAIAMILTYLAFRYILKDELLIKSLNRLR